MSGYVYVVKNESNKFKIGYTRSSIEKRIASLQTASNELIELFFYFIKEEPDVFEKELHSIFSEKRIRGEWFELDDNDIKKIAIMDGVKELSSNLYGVRWMQINQECIEKLAARKDIEKVLKVLL